MSKSKNLKQNPIEDAIGNRAKDPNGAEKFTQEYLAEPTNTIPEMPSPSEMKTLESLNQSAEERLGDKYPETDDQHRENQEKLLETAKKTTPVSKPDLPPVTKNSSRESPPQVNNEPKKSDYKCVSCGTFYGNKNALDGNKRCAICISVAARSVNPVGRYNETADKIGIPKIETPTMAELLGQKLKHTAEDRELTALKHYILDDGFVLATVAFHIVSLCAEPLTTPSTTNWDFVDRAKIPDMVLALLNQPGYLDGIWPSLKIIMGDNKGNPAWTAGISTTIAFFDVIRTLPTLKELKNESI